MNTTEIVHPADGRPVHRTGQVHASRWSRLAPWLLIGGLVLVYAAANWMWLAENVTWTGWDKPRHLAFSLYYAQLLSRPSLRSLFAVAIADPVRTPLFSASAAIPYTLLGRSADAATMVNLLYLAAGLAATYTLGRRWAGRPVGLTAAALLASFPMFYAMSRHFYLEFALAAMVAVTVSLLLATNGFQRRGRSLLFGLSLGLTLLTKRTSAVFVAGPVMVVILAAGLLPLAWQRLHRRPQLHPRPLALAGLIGLLAAALWYLPNRDQAQGLFLGDGLFAIWWALSAAAAYFALLPPAPLANALAAFLLAAGLASTWYLVHLTEFVHRVGVFAYGIDDPRGRQLNLGDIDTYLYYLRKLGNEHLSFPVLLVFAAVLAAAGAVFLRRQRSIWRALRALRPEAWAVLAWVGGGYLFLTLSIYQEARAFTPVLPAVALIFAAALAKLPRRGAQALLAAVLTFGAVQFAVLSYEPAYRLLPPSRFQLPVWGRTSLMAQGVYIQLPDEGSTDRRYAIQPDVLARMEQRRRALGRETLSLGLLANTSQINAGAFNYLMLTEYPALRVKSFIERFDTSSPYRELFGQDYLAVKRTNTGMSAAQESLIRQLLDAPPELFRRAFELETTYALPDGDTVSLFRQRHPLPAGAPTDGVQDAASRLGGRARPGDVILLAPAALAAPFVPSYGGPADIALAPATDAEMDALAAGHERAFLVIGDPSAGAGGEAAFAQAWLNQNAFRAAHEWAGGVQLVTYGLAGASPPARPAVEAGATWDGPIRLVGYHRPAGAWRPGAILPLTLFWQGSRAIGADYQVFVHLIGPDGQTAAQTDSPPAGGSRPTSGWQPGETIIDRHGLPLPDGLAPGAYELRVGLYLPATGERLPIRSPTGEALGDGFSLGRLTVTGP